LIFKEEVDLVQPEIPVLLVLVILEIQEHWEPQLIMARLGAPVVMAGMVVVVVAVVDALVLPLEQMQMLGVPVLGDFQCRVLPPRGATPDRVVPRQLKKSHRTLVPLAGLAVLDLTVT
jgi:hypothetical protein